MPRKTGDSTHTPGDHSADTSKEYYNRDSSRNDAEPNDSISMAKSRSKGFSISKGSLKVDHVLNSKSPSNNKEVDEKNPKEGGGPKSSLASKTSGSQSDAQISQLLSLVDKETYILNESTEFNSKHLHAATLETLILLLPFFDLQDIKAFLYTYRTVCTPTKLLSLICEAWEMCGKNLSDANTLQAYRLRTFNVLKTWVMIYTQDFDADMFCRLRQFVASIPSNQYSESAKNHMMDKIDQRFGAWKQDKSYRRESDAVFEVLKAFGKKGVMNEYNYSITGRILRQNTEASRCSTSTNIYLTSAASRNEAGNVRQSQELVVKTRNSMMVNPSSQSKGKTAVAGAPSSTLEKQDIPELEKKRQSTNSSSVPLKSCTSLSSPTNKGISTTSDKKSRITSCSSDLLLTAISPKSLAEQLTLLDHSVYKCITPSECINQAWARENGRYHALHILRCIDLFNVLSAWISNLVLSISSVDQRAVALTWIIKLGSQLQELRNYHSLIAVVAACESAPIARLKKTWSAVETSSLKMLESLKQVISSEGSFKKLRQLMKTGTIPMVPYIGVYLGDLTFIEDGNPEMIEHNGKTFVNFTKMKLLAKVIDEIVLYQMEAYKIEYDPRIVSLLEEEFSIDFPSDKELYERSLQHEPREE